MRDSTFLKKALIFIRKNYVVAVFTAIVGLVIVAALVKLVFSEKEIVYVKVKVSQGLWWANTLKPPFWMTQSLKVGDKDTSLSGTVNAEIMDMRFYPMGYASNEQYDTFLLMKLNADYNEKLNKYSYKRSSLVVGSPIDFDFSGAQMSGTILEVSSKPIQNTYVEKTLILKKDFVRQWEYDAIPIGDTFNDGKEVSIIVIDKEFRETYANYDSYGNNYPIEYDTLISIYTTVKMKLREQDGILMYREELPIQKGRKINLQTSQFFFEGYTITDIK